MAAVFTAVDVSTLAASVTTIVVAFVGVRLIFTGYKFAKQAMRG